MYKYIKTDISI